MAGGRIRAGDGRRDPARAARVALAMGPAPQPVRLLVTIAIEVFLMTYVLMPRLTRRLARWNPSVSPTRT